MEGTTNPRTSGSTPEPAIAFPPSQTTRTREENSGLYEIQALAKNAKRRHSQRMSSEMDAQDSLLASAAALDAIALPDPEKSTELPVPVLEGATPQLNVDTAASVVSPTATPAAPVDAPKEGGSHTLLIAGVGILAVAAAVAFFVLRGGATDDAKTVANDDSVAAVATPVAHEESAVPAPSSPPAVAALDDEDEGEAAPAMGGEAVEPETEAEGVVADSASDDEAGDSGELAVADTEPANKRPERSVKESRPKAARAEKSEHRDAKKVAASAPKTPSRPEPKADEPKKSKSKKGSEGESLDDVLSSVTGGIDRPVASHEEDKKPSKKRLDRGDVAKAMGKISGKAKSCYSVEEFNGTVMVKYSVNPDGSVVKAKAMGAHASSKTGKCVVAAVKKAKFPAFSGPSMSFTFPFLLTP